MKKCPYCDADLTAYKTQSSRASKVKGPSIEERIIMSKKSGTYKPHAYDGDWQNKRAEIIRRDDYTCMRCDKRPNKDKLTVHHIKPRSQGGGDYSANLLTLCKRCHDYVEGRDLFSVSDIIGSYPEPIEEVQPKRIRRTKQTDVTYRPAWNKPHDGTRQRRRRTKPDYSRIYGPLYELAQLVAQGYTFDYLDLYGTIFETTVKNKRKLQRWQTTTQRTTCVRQ